MADKFVALKKLPFAEANTVFSPDGYLLLLNDLTFNAGKLKYNLKLGVDFRNFIEGKDDSLPVSNVPKSTDDLISDIGSYGAMAYVVYTGYKQGKGIGYYAGYGFLGWALGGAVGRLVGKIFLKEYTGDVAEVSQSKEATTENKPKAISGALDENFLNKTSEKLSAIAKVMGNNISAKDIKTNIVNMSKSYTPIEKEFTAVYFGAVSNLDAKKLKANPMLLFSDDMNKQFEPLIKKYGQEAINKASAKVNSDFDKAFPKNPFL
jgi:hypothetical protein